MNDDKLLTVKVESLRGCWVLESNCFNVQNLLANVVERGKGPS